MVRSASTTPTPPAARPAASACPPAASTPSRAAGPRTSSTGCSVGTPPLGRCAAESSGTAWLARTAGPSGPSGLVGPASGPTTGAPAQLADRRCLPPGEQPPTVYPYILITGRLLGHYLGITTLE